MVKRCTVCTVEFDARRSTAKYCSDRCRKRASRGLEQPASPGLVRVIERELLSVGALDTYPGQLAVELARQMTSPGITGVASLSKELRAVMNAATGDVSPEEETPGDAIHDDEGFDPTTI